MKKAAQKISNHSTRVHATKKTSGNGVHKSAPLKLKQINEGELKSSRNPAYTYLVK